jgi:hypothetical protein
MPETNIVSVAVAEPLELSLATTATPEELRSQWQELCVMAERVGAQMTEIGRRWKETTDPTVKQRVWVEYEAQTREYRVLASWKDVFYAAFIFSTDGAACAALDDSPLG